MDAAFNGELDTQNSLKFDEVGLPFCPSLFLFCLWKVATFSLHIFSNIRQVARHEPYFSSWIYTTINLLFASFFNYTTLIYIWLPQLASLLFTDIYRKIMWPMNIIGLCTYLLWFSLRVLLAWISAEKRTWITQSTSHKYTYRKQCFDKLARGMQFSNFYLHVTKATTALCLVRYDLLSTAHLASLH